MARKLAAVGVAMLALAAVPASSGAIAISAHSVHADLATNGNYIRANATTGAVPLGTFTINLPGAPIAVMGRVVCMSVSGNMAYLVYVDTGTFRRDGTVGGYIRLLDGADADAQNNGRFAAQGLNREVANHCPIPTSGPAFHPLHPIDAGTITIS